MNKIIPDFLNNTYKNYPQKIAFIDEKETWRFQDIKKSADSIATVLIQEGYFKCPIAVIMEKSASELVAFCGISLSGNFYTVIDDNMPRYRQQKILETFSPIAIITDDKNFSYINEVYHEGKVFNFSDMIKMRANISIVENASNNIIDTDLLYVLFTSGSTGVPKGVTITHRSVVDYITWAEETFSFDETTIIGNQAPFYFDNSVLDIYTTLMCGATMYIIPRKCFAFPATLLRYINEKEINTVFWVPTVLSRIASLDILGRCDVTSLKKILFAGEVMPTRVLNVWRRHLPEALYANLYGPTEITVDCTYYIVDREFDDIEPLPIGKRCKNTQILLLDENLKPVNQGNIGEIVVRGSSLSLGYYNANAVSKDVFIQNPMNDKYVEFVYKTGDLGHVNEYGELIFDGRKDMQIKHGGHRIELGEIENAVSVIPTVMFNACLFDSPNNKIVLFYQGEVTEEDVRIKLMSMIPEYMIPAKIVKIKDIPLTENGKIDRMALMKYLA